jgi:hypothetical protein
MMTGWLKLWDEAQNDPKLETLTDAQHRVWFRLLCFANKQEVRGVIPYSKPRLLAIQVANSNEELLAETIEVLCNLEILECHAPVTPPVTRCHTLAFIKWGKRQARKPSDEPEATRSRQQKSRNSRSKSNVTPLSRDVTLKEEEEEVEEEEEKKKINLPVSPQPVDKKKTRAEPDDNFEQFWREFKAVYPERDGKRVGIDSVAKEEARALSSSTWDSVIVAARHYAASERLPVDPLRFFKSKEYPNGFWREFIDPPSSSRSATNGHLQSSTARKEDIFRRIKDYAGSESSGAD